MNKEEIEQQIKCIEVALKSHENGVKVSKEKLAVLKEQLETVGKRWKPKNGETCWCLTAGGLYEHIFGSGDKCDELYYNIGNCFKTYDEAKKSMDRRLAEQELLDMCDFQDAALGIKKGYEIVYDLKDKEFFWNWFQYNIRTQYRFVRHF